VAHFGRRAAFPAASSAVAEFGDGVTLLELFHILAMTATGRKIRH